VKPIALSLVLALTCVWSPVVAQPAAAAAVEPDWAALLGPFPQPGSQKAEGERAIMLWLQANRTRADVARAKAEDWLTPDCFSDALGKAFTKESHPKTFALLETLRKDSRSATGAMKDHFHRPRPFVSCPEVTPALAKEDSFSYPSGHATLGAAYARILAELAPAQREAILERGNLIGNDRTMAGMHWPSAGRRLGEAFAAFWMSSPEHRKLINDVRVAEWH